jgi:glutaredoxin
LFSRSGCPHCAAASRFLDALRARRPALEVVVHDVVRDPAARERLERLARERAVTPVGVPSFLVCGELLVGFAGPDTTGRRLAALVGAGDAEPQVPDAIDLPLLGRLELRRVGLLAFTVAVGLVDGINPCAMWVLLFLLSILVNVRDRRRMVLVAGTFVGVSGVAYFLFMAAWLSLFLVIGLSRVSQLVLGTVALGVGALNVKDFFALGRGLSLRIPERARPGIYARVRGIVQADDLRAALAGAFVLAVLVNAVELLCTAGLPAVYTRILTLQELPTWQYYAYLALYNVAYVLDDSLVVAAVVLSFGRHKLEDREARWLKLCSGCVMLLLGFLLLVRPGWLLG